MVDDRWGLSPISKLAGQAAAGGILFWSGVPAELAARCRAAGRFLLTPDEATVLTIFLVVATINAVNFIDGLDGLAAGIVCIAAIAFFVYYYRLTQVVHPTCPSRPGRRSCPRCWPGRASGFLPHNFYPARIFMGDTGSMLLGLLLAYVPISSINSLDPGSLHSGREPVPGDPAAAAAGHDPGDPVRGPAARRGAAGPGPASRRWRRTASTCITGCWTSGTRTAPAC